MLLTKFLAGEMDYFSQISEEFVGYPVVNISHDKQNVVVNVELPGLKKDQISLDVNNNVLSISGEIEAQQHPETTTLVREERRYGKINRQVGLPYPVNLDQVQAELHNGILTITMGIAKEAQPRQITIK